jgi:hypothetical protein
VNTNRKSCGKWSIFVEKDGGLYSPGHQTYLTCSNDSFVASTGKQYERQITGSATEVGDDERISSTAGASFKAAALGNYGKGKIALRCDATGRFFTAYGSLVPVYAGAKKISVSEVFVREEYRPDLECKKMRDNTCG